MLQFSFNVPNMHLILSHSGKEILKTSKMDSGMNTSPISNEKEKQREKKKKGKWNIMYEPISNENQEKQNEFQV